MAQIYLVRHTRVDVPHGICYGFADVPLANTFNNEALTIKEKLKCVVFDKIYSSPSIRCSKLASYLVSDEYSIDDRLKELNFGEWEGKEWDVIYQTPYGKEWMNNYLELPCPGGESYFNLFGRIKNFINSYNFNDTSLIITHSGVIRAFQNILTSKKLSELFRQNIAFGDIVKIDVI
jgi:alpha-ribazole phosphatase